MPSKREFTYAVVLFAALSGCTKKYPVTSQRKPVQIQQETTAGSLEPTPSPVQSNNRVLRLEFSESVDEVEANRPFKIALRVVDENGKVDESFNEGVTVWITAHPEDGTEFLSGNGSGQFNGGQATVDNLSIEKLGTGYVLSAKTGSLVTQSSRPFNVVPARPKDIKLILNGKRAQGRFIPPDIIEVPDGDRLPIYNPNINTFSVLGKHYRVKIISPTEVSIDEIPVPMKQAPGAQPSAPSFR